MRPSIKRFIDPRQPSGGYFTPHLVTLVAIVGAFALGLGVGRSTANYNAAYFRAHFPNRVLTMRDPHVVGVVPARPTTFAPTASIHTGYYPAVGNQGTLGQCAAYANAWALSYEWRITHPGSWLRFSAICQYSYYSDTYNGGQDGGSWPPQDAEFIPTRGIAKFLQVPEASPQQVLNPVPGACFNTNYRAPVSFTTIGYGDNEGQGAIDGIKAAISGGFPVEIAFPVYPEYDNATYNGGLVDVPQAGEASRGGHENVILAYDDSKFNGRGGFLIQNQWSTLWGLKGRAWMSYDFVRTYVFSVLTPHIGSMVPKSSKPPTFVPNHGPKHLLEPNAPVSAKAPTVGAWYVKNVVLRDSGQNISSQLNYWGDRYKIAPYGLAAVAATESGWRQIADRYGVWPDVSFGLMQFTVSTASGYGVCRDTQSCRTWLDVPSNAIALAARYLSEARYDTCVDWPWLYVAYNAGSGYGCANYFYTHPTGQAYSNLYGNFIPNYNVVLAGYLSSSGGYRKVTPKPRFPLALWRSAGHKFSPYYKHHLNDIARAWVPISGRCKGATRQWAYNRHSRFSKETFQRCSIFVWSGQRGYHPKVTY